MDAEIAREIEESAFNYGYAAAYHARDKYKNPFYTHAGEHDSWNEGFDQGKEDMKTDG